MSRDIMIASILFLTQYAAQWEDMWCSNRQTHTHTGQLP